MRKLGLAALACGIVLAASGASQVKKYQEEKFDQSKSEMHPIFGRDDYSNFLAVKERNRKRAWEAYASLERAKPFIYWGGAISFGGLVLAIFGGRKKKSSES